MSRQPGKTYPSDHRRWFRVTEDILDDEALESVSADVFRFYFRLLAMLNRTKARDGVIRLGRHALNACAMREQHRHALSVARSGAVAGLYALSEEGAHVVIAVPKWSEIQELAPKQPQRDPDETPATTPTPNTTPRKKGRGAPKSPSKRERKIDERAIEAWPRIREAFAHYGKEFPEALSLDRADNLVKRLDDGASVDDLVSAVHGKASEGLQKREGSDYDPWAYFQPSTIFKRDGFSDRVDKGRQGGAKPRERERVCGCSQRISEADRSSGRHVSGCGGVLRRGQLAQPVREDPEAIGKLIDLGLRSGNG
jgi:hypothetical protein